MQMFKHAVPSLNYANFEPTAAYLQTRVSTKAYLKFDPHPTCWARMTGCYLANTFRDTMHTLQLGIERDLDGAVLVDLNDMGFLGAQAADVNLKKVWVDMRKFFTSLRLVAPTGPAF